MFSVNQENLCTTRAYALPNWQRTSPIEWVQRIVHGCHTWIAGIIVCRIKGTSDGRLKGYQLDKEGMSCSDKWFFGNHSGEKTAHGTPTGNG